MLEEEKIPETEVAEAKVEENKETPRVNESNNKKAAPDPEEFKEFKGADNVEEVVDSIEKQRVALLNTFKKSKNISRIIMGVVVVAVIASIVMIFNGLDVLRIVGYSIAGVVMVGMIVYYVLSKGKFPAASREYIANVTTLINSYNFNDPRFTDLKYFPNKKLNKTDLEVDRVYKNSSEIGSRNFISGKFDGHEFEVSENVLYAIDPSKRNQRSVVFLGKYITFRNNFKFEGRYIFNIKGIPEKLIDQPNDIDDLVVAIDEPNFILYAPNDKAPKDVLGTKLISAIKDIQTNEKLLNAVVVIWAGHTAIYLSYEDTVTVLPFEHPFNKEGQDQYKGDLVRVLELASIKK